MSLSWYARRLASMSAPEVVHRVGEQAKKSASRRHAYGWAAFRRDGGLRPIPALRDLFVAGVSPGLAAAIRAAADRHLDGHFSAHGTAWPRRDPAQAFPEALWRLDPVTLRPWPGSDAYCHDLKYRHRRDLGDIKYVWDLNRLQFLQPLAAAVALWDDRQALATIEAALTSWARSNPPFRGLAWNSGIELALRAVSLVVVAALCGDRLSPGLRDEVATILRAHLYWLSRFPSRFSSANNHLVAEALGEFVIATVLEGGGADAARRTIEAEVLLQILPDGCGAEQSPTYAAFTAEMLLFASLVARAYGRPLAAAVGDRLQAFATFVGWLSDGHGRVPEIGDNDGGRVLSLCADPELAYPASVARAVSGHYDQPPQEAGDCDMPELRDAFFPARHAAAEAPLGVRTFASGGYSVVRERRAGRLMRLVLDHGPLGYLAIAAHGHADANAITLSLDGEEVIVDAGTYLYHSGAEWRDWFRGTPAHNTLAVEGANQSVIAGPFNWSHKANARLDAIDAAEPWSMTASHDGYVKRFGVEHRRTLRATDAGFVMVDTLPDADRPLAVATTLQFAPGLALHRDGGEMAVCRDGRRLMRVALPNLDAAEAVFGGGHAQGGWVSGSFGAKSEAVRLVWRGLMPADGLRTEFAWG